MKTNLKKMFSLTLAGLTLLNLINPTFAIVNETQTTNTSETLATDVLYKQDSSFVVTVPKKVSLENDKTSTYEVIIEGDIASNEIVTVIPEESFQMYDQAQTGTAKTPVTATVIQDKISWKFYEFETKGNGTIKAPDLTSGTWKGNFWFNIELKDENTSPMEAEMIMIEGHDDYNIDIPNSKGRSIIATSSDNSVATVSVDENNVVIEPQNGGIATITVIMEETEEYPSYKETFKLNISHDYVDGVCERCGEIDITDLEGGLYDENWNKIEEWQTLIDNGVIHVNNGVISTNYYWSESTGDINSSKDVLIGKLVIPEGITGIIDNCFFMCNELTDIVLPSTIEEIGSGGLMSEGLDNIMVSNKDHSFKSVSGILYNADMTTIIEYPAHKQETHFDIPNSVTKINGGAFYKVHALESVTIPENVTHIGNRAFDETSLTEVTLPDKVTYLGDFAFRDTKLSSVTLNDNLEFIGYWAFGGCWRMEKIFIPASIQTINCNILSDGLTYGPFVYCSEYLKIYCELEENEIPAGWDKYWNGYGYNNTPEDTLLNVIYGVTREEFNDLN